MNKAELKHYSAYLPHNTLVRKESAGNEIITMTVDNIGKIVSNNDKLILRPISDIVREIEVNGYRFVPIIKLAELFCKKLNDDMSCCCPVVKDHVFFVDYIVKATRLDFVIDSKDSLVYHTKEMTFTHTIGSPSRFLNNSEAIEFMDKLHFDRFMLIPEGLAIDFNTIKL